MNPKAPKTPYLPWPMLTFARHPVMGAVVGLLISGLSAWGFVQVFKDYRRFSGEPVPVESATAVRWAEEGQAPWVRLKDARALRPEDRGRDGWGLTVARDEQTSADRLPHPLSGAPP